MFKSVALLKSVWAPAAAFLAGVPLAVTGYNLGRMQASQPPAAGPVAVVSAPVGPALAAAPVPAQTYSLSATANPVDAPAVVLAPRQADAETLRRMSEMPVPAAPPVATGVGTTLAQAAPAPVLPADVPPEAFIQLGIKPTGKSRPSTVGRAPEPPKGAVVSDPRPVAPRNPWGEPTVYAPAWRGPRDGYGYGYRHGYDPRYPYGSSYCPPEYPRRQEPLLPFAGSSRSEREGRTQQTGRFTTR